MPADRNVTSPEYDAGGYAQIDGTYIGSSPSEWLGRVWNNFSGKTAENMFNAQQAALTRVYNSAEAQKDRDFQEYMANTAYQRGIADMKAAGLNPAAIGGNAADVPSGAMASASPAHSSGTGTSGGLLGGILRAVISGALFKKFSSSAMSAGSAASAVSRVGRELNETRRVIDSSGVLRGYMR